MTGPLRARWDGHPPPPGTTIRSSTALQRILAGALAAIALLQAPAAASLPGSLDAPTTTGVERLLDLHRQAVERQQAAQAAALAEAMADVFAVVDGLWLHLPGREVRTIGYHEARAEHLTLVPQWASSIVMPSRGREGTPTSAVDIVLDAGVEVLAPVSGTIHKAVGYLLYDEYQDAMVQIIPDGRPDLLVTMYHLEGVRIREGHRVEAGETVIANGARAFDFISQVEQWGRGAHVDLRVQRR